MGIGEFEGDFFMVLKSKFDGPRQYVPFVDCHLVTDSDRWLHERYTGNKPTAKQIWDGLHPDYPDKARLWYELDFENT